MTGQGKPTTEHDGLAGRLARAEAASLAGPAKEPGAEDEQLAEALRRLELALAFMPSRQVHVQGGGMEDVRELYKAGLATIRFRLMGRAK